jgi:hypothetical protein
MTFVCDNKRHLVCLPYSISDLHWMADRLKIGRHFFHRDHYDIPKRRVAEIMAKCTVVNSRQIVLIIRGTLATIPSGPGDVHDFLDRHLPAMAERVKLVDNIEQGWADTEDLWLFDASEARARKKLPMLKQARRSMLE